MNRRGAIWPISALALIVALRAFGVAGYLRGPASAPVDNPVEKLWIELSGPGVRHGIYTNFQNPLTVRQLCGNLYSSQYCREILPDDSKLGERAIVSGDRIAFPYEGRGFYAGKMSGGARVLLGIRLDPNVETAEDLEAVPGIGPKTAEKIIRRRESKGPIRSGDELQRLVGARVDAPRYFGVDFTVESPPPGGANNQEGRIE